MKIEIKYNRIAINTFTILSKIVLRFSLLPKKGTLNSRGREKNNSLDSLSSEITQRRHAADHLVLLHNHYICCWNSRDRIRLFRSLTRYEDLSVNLYSAKHNSAVTLSLILLKIIHNVDLTVMHNSSV